MTRTGALRLPLFLLLLVFLLHVNDSFAGWAACHRHPLITGSRLEIKVYSFPQLMSKDALAVNRNEF